MSIGRTGKRVWSNNRTRTSAAAVVLAVLLVLLMAVPSSGRALKRPGVGHMPLAKTADFFPVFETRLHAVGQLWFALTNFGLLGTEGNQRIPAKDLEPLRIDYSPSFEYPAGTRNDYLYAGGLWIGGIIGTDTLVSLPIDGDSFTGDAEFASYDTISESSNLRSSIYADRDAHAEQEFYAVFSDTAIIGGTDEVENRPHLPLNVEVSQTSFAWSDRFSRQFVIIQCWIKNIGRSPIAGLTAGLFLDADVLNQNTTDAINGSGDDLSGFLSGAPSITVPQFRDSLDVTWVADNDGDPVAGTFPLFSPRGVVGVRVLHAFPSEDYSFNWWLRSATTPQNWGPSREGARVSDPSGSLGAPTGDRYRYAMMTNGEIDYGQMFAAIDYTGEGWRAPLRGGACAIANGLDTRQLASVGPACDLLYPGDSTPFVYAVVGGQRFHTDPKATFDCTVPHEYANTLGFADLAFGATWAGWIYDTPGLDSDGDDYRGEYHLVDCDSVGADGNTSYGCDTVYYTGDLGPPPGAGTATCEPRSGRADLAGPVGPSCPQSYADFFVETFPGEITVRWTGRSTESAPDLLSKKKDFEGYRLYTSRINSSDQYSLVASWDIEDYKQLIYNPDPPGRWNLAGDPVSYDSLRQLYGEAAADSIANGEYSWPSLASCRYEAFYDDNDSLIERCSYFAPQDYNCGNVYVENGIEVQNTIQKIGDSTIIDEFGDTLTFGIYEAHLTDLNASNGLFVSLTAFDYGNAAINLDPLESLPGNCNIYAIPVYSAQAVEDRGLQVSVYPNPYKTSFEGPSGTRTTYFDEGFEAPEKRGSAQGLGEEDRRIWFINLPSRAIIRIYTLDGDLVRTIEHEDPMIGETQTFLSDYSSRAAWDLVSRNTQAVVSGIYIYRVDSDMGSQVGKIVIIK